MPESVKALEKLDLLVVADPHPTTWVALAVKGGRKENTYMLPVCTQLETSGSRVASTRSLQVGAQIVKPSLAMQADHQVIYLLAPKPGHADLQFNHRQDEGARPV